MRLAGRVALITGAARGLGRAYAKAILERKGKVSILDVREELGKSTELELGAKYGSGNVLFIATDVTSDKQVKDAFDKTLAHFGRLDVVINNAGVNINQGTKACYDVNIFGVMRCTELAVAHMRSDNGGKGGIIINIGSVGGIYAYDIGHLDYQATKHAVVVYTRGLAAQLGSANGIRMAVLCPHRVKTEFLRHLWDDSQDGPQRTPEEEAAFWVPLESVAGACMKYIEDESLDSGIAVKITQTDVTIVSPEDSPVKPLFTNI